MACTEPMVTCSPPPSAPPPVSPPQNEPRLTCEFCGKRDFIYKFARSRRFCSVTCSKRFSAYSMRKAPDGSVTGRPTTMSSKNSRSKASVAQVWSFIIIIIRPQRTTTYVDAAYCYRPSSVVCRSVTVVSPAKTIDMLFGLRTTVTRWAMY